MRKKLIAANWKMHKSPDQARHFVSAFLPLVKDHDRDEVVLCPPFICLPAIIAAVHGSRVGIGGQNVHWEKEGAYTGEISAHMLREAGCSDIEIERLIAAGVTVDGRLDKQ